MFFAWNFRRQTTGANEPYLTDWKNDSQQSDEIKANWNQATDTKKQCKTHFMAMKEHAIHSLRADPLNTLYAIRGPAAPQASDTKPTQLLRRSRTQNISLCFLISISAVILKVMLKLTSIPPLILGSP